MPESFEYKNFNDLKISIKYTNEYQDVVYSYCEQSRQFLINFYEQHPEIEFIEATISADLCGYDWEVDIHTEFKCTLVGDDQTTNIEATWDQSGCSCNEFTGFQDIEPNFTNNCVYENGKWYKIPTAIINKMNQYQNVIKEKDQFLYQWKDLYDKKINENKVKESNSVCIIL